MFSLNNFVASIDDIPSDWIFENYLNLPEKLSGQNVRMKSLFNPDDRDPSMYLYYVKGVGSYRYKCFSTGKSGNAVDLMAKLWGTDYKTALYKVMDDYQCFLKTGKKSEKKEFVETKWIVSDYFIRSWTKDDAEFWLQFNIGSKLLEEYNVIPIRSYTMTKQVGNINTEEEFNVQKKYTYLYTTKYNEMYKIYQPKNATKKFLKLMDHTQGIDQLQGKRFLVITSSLKDCMAIRSIPGLDVDVIAPDSENTKLDPELIHNLKDDYEAVVTYMDSDAAGITSMQFYFEKYNLPFCYIPLEKDFSDIVKVHGIKKAIHTFVPVLDKAVAKYKELNQEYIDNKDLVY
jgi:hypothetical protein